MHRGAPVRESRDMPRHKLEVIKSLTLTTEPVKTVTCNVLGPFPNFSREGSKYN